MIILKLTKKQGFTLCLENAVLEKFFLGNGLTFYTFYFQLLVLKK